MNKRRWRIGLGMALLVGLCGVVARAVITPNMNLNLPTPGQTYGPFWANQVNQAFEVVDAHDHTRGKGLPVPSAGLNINADVPWNSNNIIGLLGLNFTEGSASTIPGTVTVSGVDLFFTDENGNQIQLTCSGGVCGTPGSIAGLVSPASASYDASTGFTWLKNSTTPAAMNFGALVQALSTTGNSVTTVPSGSQTSSYTLTDPIALPPSSATPYFSMTSSTGLESFSIVDNSTLGYVSGSPPTIAVRNGGITMTQLASNSVGINQITSTASNYNVSLLGTSANGHPGFAITATACCSTVLDSGGNSLAVTMSDPTGRPIRVFTTVQANPFIQPSPTAAADFSATVPTGVIDTVGVQWQLGVSGSTSATIGYMQVQGYIDGNKGSLAWPGNLVDTVYKPAGAGTYTFTLQAALSNTSVSGSQAGITNVALAAYLL